MVFMKRFAILIALSAILAGNCVAQSAQDAPASKEDIQRYLEAIHSHDMVKQMLAAMSKSVHQLIHEQYIKDKDKLPADFEVRMTQIVDDMWNDMPLDEMMQAMVPSYQKHFTKGDIDGLVAFYSSATGQKVLHEMPAIMSEAMQAMTPIMQKQMETVQARVQQQTEEMMKQSEKKPSPTSTTRKN